MSDNSLSFRIKRFLYAASAFMKALFWGQRTQRFKVGAALFGGFVFFNFLLLFLVLNKSINYVWSSWGGSLLLVGYFTVQWLFSRYFNKKEPSKSQPYISPHLRLAGLVLIAGAGAIFLFSDLSLPFVNSIGISPTLPFYLVILALVMWLLGEGLEMKWRKRNKIEPYNVF